MFHKFENSWKRQIHIYKYANFYKAKRCTHTRTRREIETQNERQVHMSLNFLVRTTTRLVFWFAIYTKRYIECEWVKKMRQRQNSSKWIRESYSINSSCNWLIKQQKKVNECYRSENQETLPRTVVSMAIPKHWKKISIIRFAFEDGTVTLFISIRSWPVWLCSDSGSIHWTQLRNQFELVAMDTKMERIVMSNNSSQKIIKNIKNNHENAGDDSARNHMSLLADV